MKIKPLLSVIAISSMLAFSASAKTWNMAAPYPDATFHTQNIYEFAKEVKELSGGELDIKVHSAGSLFKHPEIKSAVRSGQVEAGEFFLSRLNNENQIYGLDSLPFFAVSYDEAMNLWKAQKPIVEKLLDKENIKVLYAVAWPPQGLYTKKEIKSINDLKGIKFRSYNSTLEEFAKSVGATPVLIEVPDIPQAFSTNRVEAMITSPSTGVNSKAWDFLTHYTDIQAWIPKNIVVVSKKAFNRLDEKTQQAILKAAATAEERGWAMSKKENTEQVEKLKANGIIVNAPSDELKAQLQEVGQKMLENWKANMDKDGEELLATYSEANK
ncbi:MAG: TRAP transporter substrate-binding protein [Alphaproteobacteria bacterium]